MNKKMSQSQEVIVSSETHGIVIEQYCPFARFFRGRGLNRRELAQLQRKKALIHQGEIKHVICEDFNPEDGKCKSEKNNIEGKRCIFTR